MDKEKICENCKHAVVTDEHDTDDYGIIYIYECGLTSKFTQFDDECNKFEAEIE